MKPPLATYQRNGVPPPMRKMSSFADLNHRQHRADKMHVIHVSDSEDDGHDDRRTLLGSIRTSIAPPSRPLSALEAREAEIQAMRAKIAAAELKRKAKRPATPLNTISASETKPEPATPTVPSPRKTRVTLRLVRILPSYPRLTCIPSLFGRHRARCGICAT
ncbi:hypothetical protein BKA62DRAFT_704005, partial [Auriculariales sp. MPI-PUGE-AT-0066]